MQYVAFESAVHRHVPVMLTDGNIMMLYAHNTKLNVHQRMYWDFGWDASIHPARTYKLLSLQRIGMCR